MQTKFSKYDTKLVKGVAIILMLMHHLWAFPDRIYGGNLKYLITLFGNSSIQYLGSFGKICVSLFFFLGGYGIYCSTNKGKIDILKNIKKIFISYWKVFLIFVPIGFLFFSNQLPYCSSESIYRRYSNFNWNLIIDNFLGVESTLNSEWWFLKSYVFAIITFPLFKKLFSKNSTITNLFIVVVLNILSTNLFPAIGNIQELGILNNNFLYYNLFCQGAPFISCFWLGIVFAKDNLIVKFRNNINNNIKLNIFSDMAIILIIIYLRQVGIKSDLDILYVPIFIIVCLDLLKKNIFIEKIIYNIGKESTNMWLIHSFFCYYFGFFAKLITWSKWAIPCLVVLIMLTFFSSKLLNVFWNFIEYLFIKLDKLLLKH